jgi:hypothetical protein
VWPERMVMGGGVPRPKVVADVTATAHAVLDTATLGARVGRWLGLLA